MLGCGRGDGARARHGLAEWRGEGSSRSAAKIAGRGASRDGPAASGFRGDPEIKKSSPRGPPGGFDPAAIAAPIRGRRPCLSVLTDDVFSRVQRFLMDSRALRPARAAQDS